jgi:hypothetical protein
MYDEFMSEIQTHHGITDIDDLTKIPFISNRFPGYFISESFPWSLSNMEDGSGKVAGVYQRSFNT